MENDMADSLYTIGHSTHPIEYFIEMLLEHRINSVIDVRSLPASRFNPQYNKKALARSLEDHGVSYLHMPDEFGARLADRRLLDQDGKVDFAKVRRSKKFVEGIDAISKRIWDGDTVVLMCSEADPLTCHRFAMISPALRHFEILHILKDKTTISQAELENRLMQQYANKLPHATLFETPTQEAVLESAFKLLNKEIGYSPRI